jgi:hypothetical protein
LPDFAAGDLVWIENMSKPPPGTAKKFQEKYLGPYKILKKIGPSNYVVGGKELKEQVIHTSRLWEFTPKIDKYESEDIVNSNTMQPATSQTVGGTEETKDTTLISADKVEIAKVIVKNKFKGKEKGKLPDPVPIEDTHVPITITVKRNTATRPMYLVKYKSNDLPHEMIKQFIETI